MSSFFTLPASQKKRKRSQADGVSRVKPAQRSQGRKTRDESISGSDISEDERPAQADDDTEDSETLDDEFTDEDPSAKRIRLAEQYLANTQKEVLEDVGFDAAEVDAENLKRRMGERLKEDTAETKGKLYRWIAGAFDWGRAESAPFRHHQKPITGVAISGRHAYTVGKDGVLIKWQLPNPELEGAKDVFPRPSRKPKRLLVSRRFGKNTNSQNADQHTKEILCVAASQDGRFVATGGADKKLIVWDAATLKPLKTFMHHRDSVVSLAFRRGTNQLFSASQDRTVKVWSLNELTYVETLFGHQDEVVDVSALTQETCITVGARDRTARLWKVVEESQLVFRGGGAPNKGKALKQNGNDNDANMANSDHTHEGSTDRVACIDDETFITGSDNGSLSLWNIHKKKAVHTYPLAHGLNPPLPLDEVSAEIEPPETARTKPTPRWITALRAIPFSDVFVTGSWDGHVRIWQISSDKRRIEPLGCLGSLGKSVDQLLDEEGLSSESISHDALEAIKKGDGYQRPVEGVINDLAIIDNGDRAKNGIIVIAAVGTQHRLGRWMEMKDCKNKAVLFEISRLGLPASTTNDVENREEDRSEEFAGFD